MRATTAAAIAAPAGRIPRSTVRRARRKPTTTQKVMSNGHARTRSPKKNPKTPETGKPA